MAEVDVAGLSAGTTHTGVTGGGSVPTARRYSLGIVQPGGVGGDAGGAKVLSAKSELKDALTAFQQTFVMCDATKPDNPIMFASEGFYQMTGYTSQETIGKNCRFLQGAETDKAEIAKLRAAVAAGESWCGRLLNYKKDGSPFWNLLTVSPVKDDNGTVVKFIGMQVEVTKYTEGAKDKETRPNALPVSLIKYDARQREEAESTVSELVAEVGNKSLQAEGGEAEGEGSGGAAVGADGKGSERRKSGLIPLLALWSPASQKYPLYTWLPSAPPLGNGGGGGGGCWGPQGEEGARLGIHAPLPLPFSTPFPPRPLPPNSPTSTARRSVRSRQWRRWRRTRASNKTRRGIYPTYPSLFLAFPPPSSPHSSPPSPRCSKERSEPAMEAVEEDEGDHKARRDGGLTNHGSHPFPSIPLPIRTGTARRSGRSWQWKQWRRTRATTRRGGGICPSYPPLFLAFPSPSSPHSSPPSPRCSKKERSEPAMEAVEEEDEGDHKARRGLDLATTLERIQKNFVITDPRLPENPIIFASDDFLELTEYSREEILGRNCRFLQGPDTDPKTVQRIRDAIKKEEDITVQLLNYTKSGKQFWNLFHLQAVRDNKGMLQYFIGVQLDASQYVDSSILGLQEKLATEGEKIVLEAANNVEGAVRELADPGAAAGDLWAVHTAPVAIKPHKTGDPAWQAIQEVIKKDGKLSLKHFRPIKPLGAGDTGSVHLVELRDTTRLFAMKAMDKEVMVNRNKVHRACTERDILGKIDFPFLPTLYASFQTATHVCLITEFCAGGELYGILEKQKGKRLPEAAARFFVAEVLLALEYLHCQGVVYRDLKPENVLVQESGHAMLTDFDLSFSTECNPKLEFPPVPPDFEKRKKKAAQVGCGGATKGPSPTELELELLPVLVAEPEATSNSFVGTEEYIAPEIISGTGHSSPVDWWTFGEWTLPMRLWVS
ncbi:unnamed protein product [Closterium sp. NIES-54]